ncbi:MAG TPA: hypothetical protein VJT31_31665 [Rugosimonospora sp.]|nr:hypothetical protein [Rugosimonospora sp.]
MVGVDHAEPTGVVDRLLWRDAQHLLGRHAEPDGAGQCVWCGRSWPCAPRRIAERAEVAAFKPWNEVWTARHDLYGVRATPSWRTVLEDTPARRATRNRGVFD